MQLPGRPVRPQNRIQSTYPGLVMPERLTAVTGTCSLVSAALSGVLSVKVVAA
jgi:hypothetical protein